MNQKENGILMQAVKPADHYHGPLVFDEVFDGFGSEIQMMRGHLVPLAERISQNQPNLSFISFKWKEVGEFYDRITWLANNAKPDNPDAQLIYQKQLANFFGPLGKKFTGKFITIKRAGSFVRCFYPQAQAFDIEGKRVQQKKDGRLDVGFIGSLPLREFQGAEVVIGEGCVATGITVAGILRQLAREEVKPTSLEVHAFAVAQRGAEFLFEEAARLGLPLRIVGGVPIFAMNEKFYLLRTEGEALGWQDSPGEILAVGDAGDWSLPLPAKYNKQAWWNKGRVSS